MELKGALGLVRDGGDYKLIVKCLDKSGIMVTVMMTSRMTECGEGGGGGVWDVSHSLHGGVRHGQGG